MEIIFISHFNIKIINNKGNKIKLQEKGERKKKEEEDNFHFFFNSKTKMVKYTFDQLYTQNHNSSYKKQNYLFLWN